MWQNLHSFTGSRSSATRHRSLRATARAGAEPARRFVGDVEGYALGAPYSVEGAALLALAKTDALLHEAWKSVPYGFSTPPYPTPSEVA